MVQSRFSVAQSCGHAVIGSCTLEEADTQDEATKQPHFEVQPWYIYSRDHLLLPSTLAACLPTEKEIVTVHDRGLGFGSDPAEK